VFVFKVSLVALRWCHLMLVVVVHPVHLGARVLMPTLMRVLRRIRGEVGDVGIGAESG
jgi:hypothetical protein